jgi:membrane-bound lytic murein transglycosylase D
MGPRQPQWRPGKYLARVATGPVCVSVSPILAVVAALGLLGCGDSVRNPVAAGHPIPIAAPTKLNVDQLPLNSGYLRAPVFAKAPTPTDGIQLLANQAEAGLLAGQQDFQRGDLSGASVDFDHALEVLQASGFDLQAEPRLADVFERIVENARNDEAIAASRQGAPNGPTGQSENSELAGIGFSPEGIPEGPVDPRLRTSAEGEVQELPHDLPLTVNDYVLAFLNFFTKTTKGRAVVENGLRRAGRYRPMIQRVLQEEGLPSDLMYLAQAESAFQPQALSSAGARGLWQFMSFRGQEYGLEHSWWVDERQDPEKATAAAAHHLRDLYDMFGDWYLAMAAYDSGPGNVQRAVERTGYADFWELYKRNVLPKETRNYVPIILALTLIAKDPSRYGIEVEPDDPLRTDTVKLTHPIDLRLVADTLDVDVDTLRALNPQLLHLVTPADTTFALHLPEGTADQFNSAMADIPAEKWLSWRRHEIAAGETLTVVAAKYHVTVAAIVDANEIDAQDPLETGDKLIIPLTTQAQAGPGKVLRYRVRASDTLETVADEFDVSQTDLKKWNHLRSNHLVRGALLTIYPGGAAPPSGLAPAAPAPAKHPENVSAKVALPSSPNKAPTAATVGAKAEARVDAKPIIHHVEKGETLYSIAKAYQTSVDALRATNKFLFDRPLQAGDTLTILPPR